MAKFSFIELVIRNKKLVGIDNLSNDQKKALKYNNCIYIYQGTTSKRIYVGQTKHFTERHQQHYDGNNDKEKFNAAHFNRVIVLFSIYLDNGTALDDVESQLITFFNADRKGATKQYVSYDDKEVINRTAGNTVVQYRDKAKVSSDVILPYWEKVLYPRGWVTTPTLEELRTRELVKYSPIKSLTEEQIELIREILDNPNTNYVINGDAGTGKTVLLTHLVAKILKDKPNARVGVIVQPNWENTGKEIFKIFGMNNDNLVVTTSTKLITDGEDYDVILVDESHKLSRNYGKQQPSFNKVYEIQRFSSCKSHLEIIQKLGKQIILMYDVLQAIRPCNITREMYANLTSTYTKKFLKTQFRIQAPISKTYTSDDYVNGIKYLLYKDTGLLSANVTNYNPNFDRDVFKDKTMNAYFGYFDSEPLHKIIDWLEEDNNYNPEHVNRVLASLVEPWQQKEGKDVNKFHFIEGTLKRRWNWTQNNWINSKDENINYKADADEQIGSIFAVQGIDLNKVGVLIGKDLALDEEGHLYGDVNNFYNTNGTFTVEEMEIVENKKEFTLFVLNIYYVLMTRGIDGIRLGFWKNSTFKEYMEKTLEIK